MRRFKIYIVLARMKGSSPATIKSYKQTFGLFISYVKKHHSAKVKTLEIDQLTTELVLDFLDHLEKTRGNSIRTRNHRLAAFKSFAKMLRLLCPEHKATAERLLHLPQKRCQKNIVGFLSFDEVQSVFKAVELKTKEGPRNYAILHLLYDAGARASETAELNLDYYDSQEKTLAILGKGNRYRQVALEPKTKQLLDRYIADYRFPNPSWNHRLFLNQRGEGLTRSGIYKICKKYLEKALSKKRLKDLSPAHSFRHSAAMNMRAKGASLTEIKNKLGHENIESTMVYLKLTMPEKREAAKRVKQYMESEIASDPKIDDLIDWENKQNILEWLDSL